MEKRSLFKTLFKTTKQKVPQVQRLQLLNNYSPSFYTTKIADSNVVQSCINTIATHASKFMIVHKQYYNNNIREVNGSINYLLQHRPNPINNTSQFIYKIVFNLYKDNNSFVYIDRDSDGMITGFYPITATSFDLLENESGTIYIRFNFVNGQNYVFKYDELIHLRRFYNNHEIFGDSNSSLTMPVNASNTAIQGIENAVKTTAGLRGIIKYVNGMLKDEDMVKYKNKFVKDYMTLENESGIAMLDAKAEFTPIKIEPMTLSNQQLDYLNENIYKYFGINKNIIDSDFSDSQWSAFYESVLEPLAIQMEQEFTTKIFSDVAIREGHRIMFVVERLKYIDTKTKISLIKEIGQLGMLTIDEGRNVLDLAPFGGEQGNKTLQTLNVVNSAIADNYQMDNTEDL